MKKAVLVIAIIVVIYLVINSKKKPIVMEVLPEKKIKQKLPTDADLKRIFTELKKNYGASVARDVEKIFRAETRHFKSLQFEYGLTPGMLQSKNTFPYGWTSMKGIWDINPTLRPDFITTLYVNSLGKISSTPKAGYSKYVYLGFDSVDQPIKAVAEYVKKYGAARWNSTDPTAQKTYLALLNSITPQYA